MLILSRRVNEKIVIGDNVVVSVIEVRGDQVKIGIEAPKSVKVYREEVFEAIQDENRRAAAASIDRLPSIELPTAKDKPSV
jgi:carbon storage regulator